MPVAPHAPDEVLSTLRRDGTRRWIRPKLSRGAFHARRRRVAWVLLALFALLPYARIGGKPAILLDVRHREFTLFGATFLPTDTVLLMLLLVGMFLAVFLLTAILGRAWCGWACPQTVYMEFVFRPLERLVEGSRAHTMALDRNGPDVRRLAKHVLSVLVCAFLAHTFLAYFVGVEALATWMTGSPSAHPAAFAVMAVTTALMVANFGWFREQTCLVLCPYGRLQSVLLDRSSLIVAYDPRRGEPRGRLAARRAGGTWGECIDCEACVHTCPTGIDIRDGLQMECIQCTQCIDACHAVAVKRGLGRGLIQYGTQDELAGRPRRLLRPRVVVYPVILLAVWGALGVALARRSPADVTVLRAVGSPYVELPGGEVSNQVRVKIVNRERRDHVYRVAVAGATGVQLVAPENPVRVGAGGSLTSSMFLVAPGAAFESGRLEVVLRVDDGAGFRRDVPCRLLGPWRETERHDD